MASRERPERKERERLAMIEGFAWFEMFHHVNMGERANVKKEDNMGAASRLYKTYLLFQECRTTRKRTR